MKREDKRLLISGLVSLVVELVARLINRRSR